MFWVFYRRDASLINNRMIRHIAVQSLYQISLIVYLLFYGAIDFGVTIDSIEHNSVIFTTFVICQIVNEVNARSITDTMNVFTNIFENIFFISVTLEVKKKSKMTLSFKMTLTLKGPCFSHKPFVITFISKN